MGDRGMVLWEFTQVGFIVVGLECWFLKQKYRIHFLTFTLRPSLGRTSLKGKSSRVAKIRWNYATPKLLIGDRTLLFIV